MKFDDASWHFDAVDFPNNLNKIAGATHIGMFVTWTIFNDLMSEEFKRDFPEQIKQLESRQITPGLFVWKYMEGKFSEYDLSGRGKNFANAYYNGVGINNYSIIYESTLKENFNSEYEIPDTWETYEKVAIIIDRAYQLMGTYT